MKSTAAVLRKTARFPFVSVSEATNIGPAKAKGAKPNQFPGIERRTSNIGGNEASKKIFEIFSSMFVVRADAILIFGLFTLALLFGFALNCSNRRDISMVVVDSS